MEFLCSFCREKLWQCCKKLAVFSGYIHSDSIFIVLQCLAAVCYEHFYLFLLFRQNSILADEMGLGKTIQSISFLIEMQVSVNPLWDHLSASSV